MNTGNPGNPGNQGNPVENDSYSEQVGKIKNKFALFRTGRYNFRY